MNRQSFDNRNRLSWWFHRLPSDILVPKTCVVNYPDNDLIDLLDGQHPEGFHHLCLTLIDIGHERGWPLFLCTDYLSGKHNWKDTCCVRSPGYVPRHVSRLVEESAMADLCGFPTDRWIARKLIPTTPIFTAFHGDMPIVKERRYFVQDAQVVCHHPYWPIEVFLLGDIACEVPNWRELLEDMNVEDVDEISLLSGLSSRVGAAIGGSWSVDWLWSEQERRWYLIDMAEAELSYHWSGCQKDRA